MDHSTHLMMNWITAHLMMNWITEHTWWCTGGSTAQSIWWTESQHTPDDEMDRITHLMMKDHSTPKDELDQQDTPDDEMNHSTHLMMNWITKHLMMNWIRAHAWWWAE
jgi:hypothetical protein